MQLESIPEESHIPESGSYPDNNFVQMSENFKGSLGLQALNLKQFKAERRPKEAKEDHGFVETPKGK